MIARALKTVFSKLAYVLLALGTSAAVFVFAVWFSNLSLITHFLGLPDTTLWQKLYLPLTLLGSIVTNFTWLSASYTIAIALLFGINLAMIVYFLRQKIVQVREMGITAGFFGIASGAIGIGCAACGSFLLTSALSLIGATGILNVLPLHGGEFGILGVILLLLSISLTARNVSNSAVCKI